MSETKKWFTAAEGRARQDADPEYRARIAQQDRELQAIWDERRRAAKPIVEALKQVGLDLTSVWDLEKLRKPYPEALPVLLEHLARPYPVQVRDVVARALGVREARPMWPAILEAFRNEPPSTTNGSGVRFGIGTALSAIADAKVFDDLLALMHDKRFGTDRIAFVDNLKRSKDPRGWATLEELKDDPDLKYTITRVLRVRDRKLRKGSAQAPAPVAPKAPKATKEPEHETSMSFDLENVGPFLRGLSENVARMSPADIQRIEDELGGMEDDEVCEWTIDVQFEGAAVPVRVVAEMSDGDSPGLAFYGSARLVAAIEEEFLRFAEARGL